MTTRKSLRPDDRMSVLRLRQTLKMARSTHAYVRGSTVRFYEWLDHQKRGTLPEGPPVWIYGDCHIGNLGPVAGVDGRVAIQIRDLDQTVIGNPAHDIIRLALSLATASRGSDLPGVATAHILEQVIEGHQAALRQDEDAIDEAPKSVQLVMKRSLGRSWKNLANERLEDKKPTIPLAAQFCSLSKSERAMIEEFFQTPPLRHLATSLRSRDDNASVEATDAAYWMKGCSSIGLLRFAVLLTIGSGKKRDLALMDVKKAVTAAAPRYPKQKMPKDQAERVVEGAMHLSPHLGNRMVAGKIEGKSVFYSRIVAAGSQDRIRTIECARCDEGGMLSRWHRWQGPCASDGRGGAQTLVERTQSPSIQIAGCAKLALVERGCAGRDHEIAYLEHCRKYATKAPS